LRQSVQKDPENALFPYHLGLAYVKTGENRKARESLQRALTLNPKFEGWADAQKTLASLDRSAAP
jgi:tetratricopeptide (TPR) repeat protein